MKTLSRSLVVCVALIWLPSSAFAQVAEPVAAPGTVRTAENEPWTFSLGAFGTYEGNVLFTGLQTEDDYTNQLHATLGRSWKLPRGGANLYGGASQVFYRDTSSLDNFRYDVGGSLNYAFTRRLQWAGSGTASSGLARDAQVLTDTGVFLPSVTARTSSATSMFSYALSRDSQLSWSLAATGVGFDSILFRQGTSLTSAVAFTTRVGRSQSVGVTQDYSRMFAGVDSAEVYGVLGTWSMSAGKGWTFYATGGIRPYTVPNEDGFRFAGTYSAGLTKPVTRNQTVGVSFVQTVEQTFGFGSTTRIVDTLSGNYTMALRSNLTASASGTYTYGRNPQARDLTITGGILQGSLNYRFARHFALSGGSTYYTRLDEPLERITSTSTFIAVTYSVSW